MRINDKGDQVPDPGDLVNATVGRTCRCGRWRVVLIDGFLCCGGCLAREVECSCDKIQ